MRFESPRTFVMLYRTLVLSDVFLHVMLVDIMVGVKKCSEYDMKAVPGRILRGRVFIGTLLHTQRS
jgi:hypothetical protein